MLTIAMLAGVLMPPARFDHEPTRPYVLHYASPQVIAARCRGLDLMVAQLKAPQARALGCTDLRSMTVWVDGTLPAGQRRLVLRHELAHVNGWRH